VHRHGIIILLLAGKKEEQQQPSIYAVGIIVSSDYRSARANQAEEDNKLSSCSAGIKPPHAWSMEVLFSLGVVGWRADAPSCCSTNPPLTFSKPTAVPNETYP
jgi:hypothetical protein